MPTLLRVGPFRFYFYNHEPNEPPHVHVDRDDVSIKIWLGSLDVAKNSGFKAHEVATVVDLVDSHRAAFSGGLAWLLWLRQQTSACSMCAATTIA